jgi:hypothetical protein
MRIPSGLFTMLMLALLATGITSATTFTVSNTSDAGAGSLRRTIDSANADNTATAGSPHVIDATGISGTIGLQSALPIIANHMSINGPGASSLTITRTVETEFRIVYVLGAYTVRIADLSVTNGSSSEAGGILTHVAATTIDNCTISGNHATFAGGVENQGGGVGTLTMNNCTISGNSAEGYAGGISAKGVVTLNNCTVSGNSALYGGGMVSEQSGRVTLNNCTVSGNSAEQGGGILNNERKVLVVNSSTISGNTASGNGGGISNQIGTITLVNSTLSGNSASSAGGGIVSSGTIHTSHDDGNGNQVPDTIYPELILTNATISGNTSSDGGGILVGSGTASPLNTIIAGNSATSTGPDIFGAMDSQGHNIIGNTSGNSGWIDSDLQNEDPELGPLQDNGGPAETMAIACGSPALDAGDNTDAPGTDQRGEDRVVDGDCDGTATIDIGAYEFPGNTTAPTITLASSATELFPANHAYHTINIANFVAEVSGCAPLGVSDVVITSVTSDEPEDASGGSDGNTLDDIVIASDCQSVQLRAERNAAGNGRVYRIHVSVADACGNASDADISVSVRKNSSAAVEGSVSYTEAGSCSGGLKVVTPVPDAGYGLSLMENYPNPFNASTVIGYSVDIAGPVRLTIVDAQGRILSTLVDEVQTAGHYSVLLAGSELASGTYYYVLESNSDRLVGSMVVSK